jgi:hypothetical protein
MIADVSGTSLFTLTTTCGSSSTTVSGGNTWTDSATYSRIQYVDVNNAGSIATHFVLPTFSLTNAGCPITSIKPSDYVYSLSD